MVDTAQRNELHVRNLGRHAQDVAPDGLLWPAFGRLLDCRQPFASADTTPFNPLVMVGEAGLGKSHLARGLANVWSRRFGPSSVECLPAVDFARRMVAASEDRQLPALRSSLASVKLMVVLDVDRLRQRRWIQQEFRVLLDTLMQNNVMIVATARRTPGSLGFQVEGIGDRLQSGLVVHLRYPDICGPGGVDRDQQNSTDNTATDDNNNSIPGFGDTAPPTLRQIVAVVARFHSLSQTVLRSKSRQKTLVHARGMVTHLARSLTDLSYTQIGAGLGGRDHSTVMHAQRQFQRQLQQDLATRENTDQILRILSAR